MLYPIINHLLLLENHKYDKRYKSITFKYQSVKGMVFLYDYFMQNRLYSDFKFYRVSKIKRFIEVRDYKNEAKNSQNLKYIQILYWTEFNIETRFDTKYHLSLKIR